MKNFLTRDTTRFCLIICLESINIDKKNEILDNIHQEFKNSKAILSKNKLKKQKKLYCEQSLYTMHKILNSTKKKDRKNKIINLLQHYSNKKRCFNNHLNIIFSKYIDKFTYKYIKYHKYNFINKYYNVNNLSLIYMYLLYKTLNTNKKFYIYKNLNLQIN